MRRGGRLTALKYRKVLSSSTGVVLRSNNNVSNYKSTSISSGKLRMVRWYSGGAGGTGGGCS